MSKLKHISKETIEEAVKTSKSYAGVLKKLNLSTTSGSINNRIKKLLINLYQKILKVYFRTYYSTDF